MFSKYFRFANHLRCSYTVSIVYNIITLQVQICFCAENLINFFSKKVIFPFHFERNVNFTKISKENTFLNKVYS